jgi:hypothetical protein
MRLLEVSKTAFMTLGMRVVESEQKNPIIKDHMAILLLDRLIYKAASVGARAAPMIPATHQGRNNNIAIITPKIIVIGKPIVSSLVLSLFSRAFNPTREASLKRTRTRAISAIKKIIVE